MSDNRASKIVILGSTGSIGRQALEVVDKHPQEFEVIGISGFDEATLLNQQIERYGPQLVTVGDERAYQQLKITAPNCQIAYGPEGLCQLASLAEADIILVALSGAVGILPTLAAIDAGKRIALANKETLVAAGDLVMARVREQGVVMIPVDSEHSAIFQCLAGEEKYLHKVWLTASGGPFREFSQVELEKVSVEMALKHPNWSMGPKITVDSATLMNKGLEVIEAHHLFKVEYDLIEVLVQRESVIHSMVELKDGSFLAHLGVADMRIPIQYALTYPQRMESPAFSLDFKSLQAIHFANPDIEKFPALQLAYQAGKLGGSMPAVLNAANEVAVNAFLARKTSFTAIALLVEEVMKEHANIKAPSLEDILQADAWARIKCEEKILKMGTLPERKTVF
ncbi:MAG: 1-deoxy-D-xylulose-5-phosphate reductoisomerase [Syntrophomonadaceae bacterium]|nr:1-deoxy-D-xylulose-5-phosphate reductoisomerase [Syntrophomonadaceae bacterium]